MSKYPIPFGRHLLLERINVGGMAEVFKAKSFGVAGFERLVAVKRILPTLAEDDEFITMFIDEARIAAHLTHQNIVQIYELGANENNYFISMEYVAGRDLRQILDLHKKLKRPMETAKACFIVSQVCEALEYAHKKRDPAGKDLKIIHRDVTPQNVIISFEGEVKLCDFGIAKAASRASRTQVGVLKGKFAYMSPEQVRGQPTDRRSDLFALGVIFYEMLTCERLFLGESDYSTLESVRNAKVPAPRKYNPNLSKELEAIVLKLLTRDPKDRYQWASEVHEDLQDHLIHEGRVFHARHLRMSMQETYARDIEIENAKLEEFMQLRLPEPSGEYEQEASLLGLDDERRSMEPEDPANVSRTFTPPRETTDDNEIPSLPKRVKESIPTKPIEYGNPAAPESRRALEGGAVPAIGSPSPVSSLFGAPVLSEEHKSDPETPHADAMVIVPRSDPRGQTSLDAVARQEDPENTPLEEVERTQFDLKPLNGVDNDTLFDERDETVGSDVDEIGSAQAELLQRLDRVARSSEDNDTLDSAGTSEEVIAPSVFDPSEPSLPAHPAGGSDLGITEDSMDDETSVSPMVIGRDDDAFAPTMVRQHSDEIEKRVTRPERDPSLRDDTEDSLPSFGEEGTVEETPLEPYNNRGLPNPPEEKKPEEKKPERATPSVRRIREQAPKRATPTPAKETPPEPPLVRPVRAAPSYPASMQPVVEQSHLMRAARDPVVLMLIAAAVGLLSLSVLAFTLLSGSNEDKASLQILTEPTREVEVKLDGAVVGTKTPVDIPGLDLGSHIVELSSPGYRTYSQRIQIEQAKPHTMVVPLEAIPKEQRPTEVTANEGRRAPSENPPTPIIDVPPPIVDAPPPIVDAPPPIENTPLRVAPPPPPLTPIPSVSPKAVPSPIAVPSKADGFLMVSTRPPGLSVTIDGKSTGLRTPIRAPHPLSPGKHSIGFVMDDGRKYEFDVKIAAGETTKLVKMLR